MPFCMGIRTASIPLRSVLLKDELKDEFKAQRETARRNENAEDEN